MALYFLESFHISHGFYGPCICFAFPNLPVNHGARFYDKSVVAVVTAAPSVYGFSVISHPGIFHTADGARRGFHLYVFIIR